MMRGNTGSLVLNTIDNEWRRDNLFPCMGMYDGKESLCRYSCEKRTFCKERRDNGN